METAYEVTYPKDMMRSNNAPPIHWAEDTIQSVVHCLEDYARAKPLSFALWSFGIGFALGWKLKLW